MVWKINVQNASLPNICYPKVAGLHSGPRAYILDMVICWIYWYNGYSDNLTVISIPPALSHMNIDCVMNLCINDCSPPQIEQRCRHTTLLIALIKSILRRYLVFVKNTIILLVFGQVIQSFNVSRLSFSLKIVLMTEWWDFNGSHDLGALRAQILVDVKIPRLPSRVFNPRISGLTNSESGVSNFQQLVC